MNTPATLYIVPTPIGNLKDMTERAVECLQSVDWIAAEDTRHSMPLLQHFSVSARTMSLHEHNEDKRADVLCQKLLAGESIALISDAGTPLINDPGFILVRKCREQGIPVVALPGACAAITALSGSGLPTDSFMYAGFLPVKTQAKQSVINELQERTFTTIFYEAPRRVVATLEVIDSVLPERHIVLAKELTKTFETYISGTASEVLAWLNADPVHQKGEFVLMIGPASQRNSEISADAMSLLNLLSAELPLKKAAAIVAQHYGLKKNALYQAALEQKE